MTAGGVGDEGPDTAGVPAGRVLVFAQTNRPLVRAIRWVKRKDFQNGRWPFSGMRLESC